MTNHDKPPKTRRIRLAAVLMALAVIAVACGSESDTISLGEDGLAPNQSSSTAVDSEVTNDEVNFRYDTFDGETVAFSELTDKPVVLNFFASWCPSCIAEMPDFEAVHQAVGEDVEFLGLAMQDRTENAKDLIEDTGISYSVGLDDTGSVFGLMGGLGMPTTVFIDADGVVQRVHSGALDADDLTDLINETLLS
jgi:thiol-disulfide isomerase/thioredoxin